MAQEWRKTYGQRAGVGLRFGNSSFLSPSATPVVRGDSDLRRLISHSGAAVPGISSMGEAPKGKPAMIPQPYNPQLAVFSSPNVGDLGQFTLKRISEGTFTEATIDNMHRAVLKAKTDARWRDMMERIRQHYRRSGAIGWKDYLGEVRALDHWYRGPHLIDYVRDPNQVEMVKAPMLTYQSGVGDCDDSSTLFAASCGVLGAPHRFRTYKADPRRPDDWSHVVSQVQVPGHGWVNNDLTLVGLPFGFEPSGFEYKDWPEPRW